MRRIYSTGGEEKIRELLVGKSVVHAEDNEMLLSDGTHLKIDGNDGCGGCESGNYWLTELNTCENLITNVNIETEGIEEQFGQRTIYRLYAIAFHPVLLAAFEGSDGNGYYGTGFWIKVMQNDD